jgi:hypothetical protein
MSQRSARLIVGAVFCVSLVLGQAAVASPGAAHGRVAASPPAAAEKAGKCSRQKSSVGAAKAAVASAKATVAAKKAALVHASGAEAKAKARRELAASQRQLAKTKSALRRAKKQLRTCLNGGTTLTVQVVNVPTGLLADLDVRGPGVRQHLQAGKTFKSAKPGTWTVTAHHLTKATDTIWAVKPRQVVKVKPGDAKVVTVDYAILVPETTEVLPPSAVTRVSSTGTGLMTVGLASSAAVEMGDTLAVGVGPSTPFGLLGSVTQVSPSGNEVTVDANAASLLDAVPVGQLDLSMPLTSADVAPARHDPTLSTRVDRNAASKSRAQQSNVAQALRRNFSCTGSASAVVSGRVSIAPTVNFNAEWSLFQGVTSATISATVVQSAELTATLTGAGNCTLKRTPLLDKPVTFRPITFMVGPVPVVLVPTLQFFADGTASFEASAVAGMRQELRASVGLNYSRDAGIRPIQSLSNTVTRIGPAFAGKAKAVAAVAPEVSVLLYGVEGPSMFVRGSLEADAQAAASSAGAVIDWNLDLRLKGAAELDIDELDLHSGEITLFDRKFDIASGRLIYTGQQPPVITTTSLPDGKVGTSYSQNLGTADGRPGVWAIASGSLPAGLTLSASGTISGSPSTAGTANFTVRFTDRAGLSTTKPLAIVVAPADCSPGFNSGSVTGSGGIWHWAAPDRTAYLSTYSGTIDWGDGSPLVPVGIQGGYFEHEYGSSGTRVFRVRATGTLSGGASCVDNHSIQVIIP